MALASRSADRLSATARPALVLKGLTQRFGDVAAVDGVDLVVREGEFVTLLGPSGSGKTTTLRMIAGFTTQSSGTIEIGGEDMSRVPPHRRDVGMVFQNYALFPHMTAAQNVGFPLEMRNVPKAERGARIRAALELVKLPNHGDRYPRQLSGGQQQRIALARAVVFQPRLLLMDEPLGALDKKLREALQLEIMHISRQLGATVIYVTHDQEEALVMSDRIAIFRDGRIEQLGSGEDLYDRPASLFVADFMGESNIFRGRFERGPDGGRVVGDGWTARVGSGSVVGTELTTGSTVALVVRPEKLDVRPAGSAVGAGEDALPATVRDVLFLGAVRKYELTLADGKPAVGRAAVGPGGAAAGDEVLVAWRVDDAVVVADPMR